MLTKTEVIGSQTLFFEMIEEVHKKQQLELCTVTVEDRIWSVILPHHNIKLCPICFEKPTSTGICQYMAHSVCETCAPQLERKCWECKTKFKDQSVLNNQSLNLRHSLNTLLLNCSVCTQRLEYADINTHLKFCSTHQQYISIQILNKAKVLMIITNLAAELSGSKVKVSELEANAMVDGTFSHEHSKTKLFFSKVSGITINTDLTGDDLDLAPLTRLYGPKIKPKLLEQVSALEKETALVNALEKETALAAHEAAGRYNQASSTQCIENKFFFPHNGQFSPDYTYQLGSRSKEEALALIIRVIASENSSYHCLSTEEAAHEFLSIKRRSTEDHWEVKSIQGISLNLAFTEHYVCFEKFLTIWRGERGKNIISKLNFKKLPC